MNRLSPPIFFFVFLTIVFSPITLFSLNLGMVPLYPVEILVLGLLSWLLTHPRNIPFLQKKAVLAGQLFLILGTLLGLLLVSGTAHGWGVFKSWFLFPIIAYWIWRAYLINEQAKDSAIAGWLIALAGIACVSLISWFLGDMTYDGRLRSYFLSPNYLAMFLYPAPFLAWYIFQRRLFPPWLTIIAGGVTLIAIYLTFSYTVWVSILLGFALWALLTSFDRDAFLKFSLGFILFSLLLVGTQWNNPKITHWFSSPERSSLASRIMIWHSAEQILLDHPLLGIGAGNFQDAYLSYQDHFPPYLEWAVPEPHNIFLAFWLEIGLIGLFGFLLVCTSSFLFLLKLTQKKSSASLRSLLFVLLSAFFIQGLLDTPYWKIDLAYLFWLILALI